MTEVDIVIPIYGAMDYLVRCLAYLCRNTKDVAYHVWCVDDCSPDRSYIQELLELLQYTPNLTVARNISNKGYGPTCNHGVSLGMAPFICLLNSDTKPQPGWLSVMLQNMRDPQVGMVGCKLLYPPSSTGGHIPGHIQHAGIYFGTDKLPREAFLNHSADDPMVNRRIKVAAVTHACVLIRRSEWGAGYDPAYLKGSWEDIDMCLEFTQRGLSIIYEPKAVVWHYQGASYDHAMSDANLRTLMHKWRDRIVPDPDIYSERRPIYEYPS